MQPSILIVTLVGLCACGAIHSNGAVSHKAYLRALFFHSQCLAQVEAENREAETGRPDKA